MLNSEKQTNTDLRLFHFLIAFLYAGAIIGETSSLSTVVTVMGPQILGRLYLINGAMLFVLPVLFLRSIDRLSRDKVLATQLLVTVAFLLCYLIALIMVPGYNNPIKNVLLFAIYPFSYLSKIFLLVTFWTMANDICLSSESKKIFPGIAATGFAGGTIGSLFGLLLVKVASMEMIIALWALLYLGGWWIVNQIRFRFKFRLLNTENDTREEVRFSDLFSDIITIKLVRVIGGVYFFLFIAIFLLDYGFWTEAKNNFPNSNQLASFQFSFFIAHAIATIGGLWFVLPRLISYWGFHRILYFMPGLLLIGTAAITGLHFVNNDAKLFFAALIVLQFLRFVTFENFFSPVYQMLFAAVDKRKRGRAKMVLDGVVKPVAIFSAGLITVTVGSHWNIIYPVIALLGAIMILLVLRIKETYIEELFPRFTEIDKVSIPDMHFPRQDEEVLDLIDSYTHSPDSQMRKMAANILARLGTQTALNRLEIMYNIENDENVRETIALMLPFFVHFDISSLLNQLFQDSDPRVRANAIHVMDLCAEKYKKKFEPQISLMLNEDNYRVKIEAAGFLWNAQNSDERQNIKELCLTLLHSADPSAQSAGIYLLSTIKIAGWEDILLNQLYTSDIPVFTKAIEVIFKKGNQKFKERALAAVEHMSRKHIAITGRMAMKTGRRSIGAFIAFMPVVTNRRMMFECVHALRVVKYQGQNALKGLHLDDATRRIILRWIFKELADIYRDGYMWNLVRHQSRISLSYSSFSLLQLALTERLLRVAEWALDVMVLLDEEGLISWGRKELDMRDEKKRHDMIEILETIGQQRIIDLVLPILKLESWEKIAKVAKSRFRIGVPRNTVSLYYFAESINRWVALCACYCLYQSKTFDHFINKGMYLLERYCEDENKYLKDASEFLISQKMARGRVVVPTFELLETVLFLKNTPLFENVSGDKLMEVAEICELKKFPKGTVISREGDISDHLYLVKSGELEVVKDIDDSRTIITNVQSGMPYGEIGLFSQSPRSASAIALSDCEIYVIQRSLLKKMLHAMPDIAFSFLEIFSKKLLDKKKTVTII